MTGSTPDLDGHRVAEAFTYVNLNERAPTPFVLASRVLVPGVHRVAGQIAPYAAYWRTGNLAALRRDGLLWVVLGDSLCQGIGASRVDRGWVPRCAAQLHASGVDHRIVNLSFSGARISDVVERQVPTMSSLGETPALVTVLVGGNDLIRREFRRRLADRFRELLGLLPDGSLIATMPNAAYGLRGLGRIVAAEPASRGLVAVPVHVPLPFGAYRRAEDYYHPDDRGYAAIASAFTAAILECALGVTPPRAAPGTPPRRRRGRRRFPQGRAS